MGGGILYNNGLRGARPRGPEDLGRVHGEQREDQGRRQDPGRSRPTATPGPRSCSSSATSTTCRGRARTSPTTTPPNKAKYADDPGRAEGLPAPPGGPRHGLREQGLRARPSYDDGCGCSPTGEGAQYPMLTFAVGRSRRTTPTSSTTSASSRIPGDDAAKNGADRLDAGRRSTSRSHDRGRQARRGEEVPRVRRPAPTAARRRPRPPADGPVRWSRAATLPGRRAAGRQGHAALLRRTRATTPALEFLSPIKGPALEQILVEVGSGIRPAEDGAALYDEDVKKQAQQLGLEGW